jgi:hypothetical protein
MPPLTYRMEGSLNWSAKGLWPAEAPLWETVRRVRKSWGLYV